MFKKVHKVILVSFALLTTSILSECVDSQSEQLSNNYLKTVKQFVNIMTGISLMTDFIQQNTGNNSIETIY